MRPHFRAARQTDRNFVVSNWFRGARAFYADVPNARYDDGFDRLIQRALRTAEVTMLCDESDPDQLFGFVVHEGADRLHWIHVKGLFRRLGLARQALRHLFGDRKIVVRWPTSQLGRPVIYDPFAFAVGDDGPFDCT